MARIGSAGNGKNRTFWTLALTMGLPFSRWGATPFVCAPMPFPANNVVHTGGKSKETSQEMASSKHPYQLAQIWRRQMALDSTLNKAKIAAREGLSRARVTQIMNLLQLPAEIQAVLSAPPSPPKIHSFSERRLRSILEKNDGEPQHQEWHNLLQELRHIGGE